MPITKMFRDRVVSMEQTFEKGEKHLTLLKALVEEAIPGLAFSEYQLDHEHDCFVMIYRTASGAAKRISWTRMVLSDAERIPAIVENAQAEIRGRLVDFLRKRGERSSIEVTFRHLEAGWVDTPEPGRPKPQPPRGKPQPPARPTTPSAGPRAKGSPGRAAPRPGATAPDVPAAAGAGGPGPVPPTAPGHRRRFRRRRGRRRGGPGSGPATPPSSAGGGPA
jgi:hypothetical protein